ncbi:hypothetical protein [Lacibacter sp. H407]|uniref:hypothetical protein n=1 Tax=Lacibacter sp. H407 TaxID=3133423 RepID=UPI0030BA70FF
MQKVILSSFLLLLLFAACTKSGVREFEPPVSKTIEFRLSQASDYSGSVYDGVQAEVTLSVSIQSDVLPALLILWDTIIPYQSLRVYPGSQTPLIINKQFNGIIESKETVRYSKVIRYRDALNQISMTAFGEDIPASVNSKSVPVDL